jgi:hypothetical protein
VKNGSRNEFGCRFLSKGLMESIAEGSRRFAEVLLLGHTIVTSHNAGLSGRTRLNARAVAVRRRELVVPLQPVVVGHFDMKAAYRTQLSLSADRIPKEEK